MLLTNDPTTPRRSRLRLPSRRVLVLGSAGAVAAAGVLMTLPRRANAYYQGPISDHFDGLTFFNPDRRPPKSMADLLRWQIGGGRKAWPSSYGAVRDERPPASVTDQRVRVTALGHASFLVQTAGTNILIDPVYAQRASPVQFAGPKRVNPPGVAFDALPRIDAVLITHNHYDHMDLGTIATIVARDQPEVITPLGNDAILAAGVPNLVTRAVDWHDTATLRTGVKIHVEATHHWSARSLRDARHALWASFVIDNGQRRIYAIGDTGFSDGETFRVVARRHPRLDLALIPIGAYEPRWFMSEQHINPTEAVAAWQLSGAARAVGHHWGTFQLTNEGVDDPRQDLAAALDAARLDAQLFTAVGPGHVTLVD
jgi:L-ascorbate metabolism protein UlaG (beta-lactamase superfamily)